MPSKKEILKRIEDHERDCHGANFETHTTWLGCEVKEFIKPTSTTSLLEKIKSLEERLDKQIPTVVCNECGGVFKRYYITKNELINNWRILELTNDSVDSNNISTKSIICDKTFIHIIKDLKLNKDITLCTRCWKKLGKPEDLYNGKKFEIKNYEKR